MTQAFPLAWPPGRPRRQPRQRRRGQFTTAGSRVSVAGALKRLAGELDRLGAHLPVISSNVVLRLDGLPRSGQAEPEDPGVCIYFQLAGKPHAMPCDTYDRVADNIAAVAEHIKATRAIDRYGVATVAEMFSGFVALPAPGAAKPWREVFGFEVGQRVTMDDVNAVYRVLAMGRHPDAGGSDAQMAELNAARDQAREALKHG
jgi:hypothetical protein